MTTKWWELPVSDSAVFEESNSKRNKKSKPGAKKRRAEEKRARRKLYEASGPLATIVDLLDDQK